MTSLIIEHCLLVNTFNQHSTFDHHGPMSCAKWGPSDVSALLGLMVSLCFIVLLQPTNSFLCFLGYNYVIMMLWPPTQLSSRHHTQSICHPPLRASAHRVENRLRMRTRMHHQHRHHQPNANAHTNTSTANTNTTSVNTNTTSINTNTSMPTSPVSTPTLPVSVPTHQHRHQREGAGRPI